MKVLVLAKQVPDVNMIRFDPQTNRIIRENVPLMMNSFDKKAVEEAIRISERYGWQTCVATMGPPQAAEMLNEALRMGINEAFLITDRAFGGSDTWVTARVLARFAEKYGADLVLTGKYSLDGETSQVPPEVATMLGVPFIPSVSKIEIGESLTVEQEMEDGLYTCTVPVPCVLSVSEKINRARAIKPDTPQMYERIRSVDAAWLGIDVNGARDSPTVVVGTQKVESQRNVQFIEPDGHLYEKVMEIIERSRAREEVRTVSLSNIKGEKEAWAIALDDARVSMEVASKVAEIASASGLRVRVIGNVDFRGGEAPPAHRLEVLEGGDSVAIANYISSRIRELRPEFVLFPSTTRGREVSSIVAAKLSLGLTADCIDVSYEGGRLVQFKPAFGGGVVARIVSKTKPEMATARPGMFRVVKCDIKPEVERIRLEPASSVKYTGFTPVPSDFRPLGASRIILSIGRGIRKRENIQKVLKLAEILGASVGGSRPIVDMNFLPRQQQVGLTGSAVSPDVYIAMGISGQDNHVVGIRYANRVIAVNTDRNAPIFRYSDYGIVMDMMEFVDSFIQFLSGKQEKA